jgi:hypothetical protein
MAALSDARLEQFCQGLAIGLDKHVAYERAGFAKDPSRSNSAKASKKAAIVQRVGEIKAELEAQRKLATGGADGFTAKSLVGQAVGMALAQGDPQVLASIAKFLDDGTLGMEASRKPLTIGEMLKLAREIDPGMGLWLSVAELLMLWDGKNNRPMPPWTNAAGEPLGPYLRETKDRGLELVP